MVGEGVMEAAPDVDGNARPQGAFGGQDRTPGREPKGAHQLRRVRDLHGEFLGGGKPALL